MSHSGNHIKFPKAILLDFDGTIADTMHDNFLAWQHAFAPYGIIIDEAEYMAREGHRPQDIIQHWAERSGKVITEPEKEAIKVERRDHFRRGYKKKIYPEAIRLMEWATEHDIPVGIVSGGTLTRITEILGNDVVDRCKVIVHADNTHDKPPKPAPDHFLYAAAELGINPADCLVIENAPYGIEAAKAAGMQCIAVDTTLSRQELAKLKVPADAAMSLHEIIKTLEHNHS